MALSKSEDDQLVQRIQSLPQELMDQIEDWVYEMSFSPAFLEDIGHPDCPARPALLKVSRRVYTKYLSRLQYEHTYIIDIGKPVFTTAFLSCRNDSTVYKIDLRFTIRDIDDYYVPARFMKQLNNASDEEAKLHGLLHTGHSNPINRIDQYFLPSQTDEESLHNAEMTQELVEIWCEKWTTVSSLTLTELTLDFSECYNFDGEWIGQDFVDWDGFRQYGTGWPIDLKVHARDEEAKTKLLQSLRRKQRHWNTCDCCGKTREDHPLDPKAGTCPQFYIACCGKRLLYQPRHL
ncbi:MAG: hypothetical protein Q9219_001384 [cf. Caloplaca sp. 3 TL-2023]